MTEEDALLAAVIAAPDDDTPRLVFADWLDEHGQPERAEFIRVQIELSHGAEDRDRRWLLERRQRNLLFSHEAEWVRPLAGALGCSPRKWGGWVFRRGFAEYFHLPARTMITRGDRLTALTPVRELFLRPCEATDLPFLCRRPWLRSVTALYLESVELTSEAIRALTASPHLAGLKTLVVPLPGGVIQREYDAFRARFAGILASP